jgi:hypothetical protein
VGGKLEIVLRDGRVFRLKPTDCAFDDIKIAPDGVTVGWTVASDVEVEGDKPCAPGNYPVAAGPVVWRRGKTIRDFGNAAGVIAWSFYGKGDLIAIHAGPTHFDQEQAWGLYTIATGRRLKQWGCSDKTPPPDWVSWPPDCGT